MHLRTTVLTIATAFFVTTIATAADDYLKAFPAAADGMVRYVIDLPDKQRGEEDDFRVEIIVGKTMETDGVNRIRLGGKIEAKPLKGWGFTYYEVEKFGPAASTLIGVPEGTPRVEKFVAIPPLQIRYNSRIPLVVYVPEGGQVRYRIWQASEKTEVANEG